MRHRSELERIWKLAELEEMANSSESLAMATTDSASTPRVVRGLEYYTGPVFEAELTFEVKGDDGKPVRFGSVGGGGRYDDLVAASRARKFQQPASRSASRVCRRRSPSSAQSRKRRSVPWSCS